MNDELIPVVLRFKNIAADSNINFTFTTQGASWCLGSTSGDSLGFSYNVINSNRSSRVTGSCIREIEFNNAILTISTAKTGHDLYSFTLTMFLKVIEGTDFLQGYCTLNNEAQVMVNFGNKKAVEWRNGRISAVLRKSNAQYRAIFLTVSGARPGNKIVLVVDTKKGLGKVNWSLGPTFSEATGVRLQSNQGELSVSCLSYGNDRIVFETSTENTNQQSFDFSLVAYVTWQPDDLEFIYFKLISNDDITVNAQVGVRQPQLVSRTSTLFTI